MTPQFPDVLKSDLITNDVDIFWTLPQDISNLKPRAVFVASASFAKGSAEETQLIKMLHACQLTEEDYNIIQFQNDTQLAWHLLRDQLQVKSVILLGVNPQQLGVSAHFMPHQLSRFNNCNWILTETLETLLSRTEIKGHLWNYGLKPAFVDKVYG
ncbi:MAG TPA: hypothetical protein PL009_01595 [Flavipsychrobacter sp.]|nr:hypothetical protein [Flavipsychrobacter sp.]